MVVEAPGSAAGDVGWVVWARHRDMEEAQQVAGFRVVSVQEAHPIDIEE